MTPGQSEGCIWSRRVLFRVSRLDSLPAHRVRSYADLVPPCRLLGAWLHGNMFHAGGPVKVVVRRVRSVSWRQLPRCARLARQAGFGRRQEDRQLWFDLPSHRRGPREARRWPCIGARERAPPAQPPRFRYEREDVVGVAGGGRERPRRQASRRPGRRVGLGVRNIFGVRRAQFQAAHHFLQQLGGRLRRL